MSHTAFSQQFDRELDFKQLLALRGIIASVDQVEFGISPADREWMRKDLLCPSCRCAGASLVRSDVLKPRGRNTRQAHFRFVNASGQTAHQLGCDFYALADVLGVQRGVDVQFDANDKDTRIVRELVCKALSIGELSKANIFNMRTWFLNWRETNSFTVQGNAAMVDWLCEIRRLPTYEALQFDPAHANLPGFKPERAATLDLAFHYREFSQGLRMIRSDAVTRERAKRVIADKQGQKLIAMDALRPQFDATLRLASLMTEYGALRLSKRRSNAGSPDEAPAAILAFSAALLFVSDWKTEVALKRFGRIIAAPVPEDLTLGNVMGLNPFYDFSALELARVVATLQPEPARIYDFKAEKASIVGRLQSCMAPKQ